MERRPNEPEYMKIPPLPIHQFRGVEPDGSYAMPELVKNRRCTDCVFLILFLVNVVILIACTVFVSWKKNIVEDLQGVDACGNVCGIKNVKITKMRENCKPEDYTNYPVFLYGKDENKCIKAEDCEGPELVLVYQRCFPRDSKDLKMERFRYEVFGDIFESRHVIVAMMSTALFLCLLMYISYRINSYITSLTLTFGGIIFSTIIAIIFWFLYFKQGNLVFVVPSVLSLVYLAAVVVILIFLGDSFSLVVRLYVEAITMLFKAPVLLVQPLISITFVLAVDVAVVYMVVLLQFCKEKSDWDHVNYHVWYVIYWLLMVYWCYGVASGCQCMIVGGVITAHFFAREDPPRFPYPKSAWITLRYHLGSVAAGSCIITILRILKPIASCLENSKVCFVVFNQCCEVLVAYISYMSKRAYIMTAIHGKNIHPSGRRAARLVWLFMCDIIVIDDLAYTCMHMASFLFTLCGLVVLTGMSTQLRVHYDVIVALTAILFTGTITFFYISLMNTVVETLILCFCEDRLMNTGTRYDRYYMSPKLFSLMIDALHLAYSETRE